MTASRTVGREATRVLVAALLTVLIGCAAVGASFGGAVGAAAAQDDPVVTVESTTVAVGANATVNLTLSSAPQGISGYNLTLTVVDPEVATITGVSGPGAFQLSPTDSLRDGTVANVEAVDLTSSVEPGATDVPLGTVRLRGETDGATTLRVDVLAMDADGGGDVAPATRNGTLTVGEGTDTATPTSTPTPTLTTNTTSSGSTPGLGAGSAVLALVTTAVAAAAGRGWRGFRRR
jgi:hypothetical protein